MLDPKLIRTELNAVAERLKIRNVELNVAHIQSLESARKEIQTRTEEMLAKRNAARRADEAAPLPAVSGPRRFFEHSLAWHRSLRR